MISKEYMPPRKRTRKSPKEQDWRSNLFFWRGAIDGKKWIGTNTHAEKEGDCLPSDDEFDELGDV